MFKDYQVGIDFWYGENGYVNKYIRLYKNEELIYTISIAERPKEYKSVCIINYIAFGDELERLRKYFIASQVHSYPHADDLYTNDKDNIFYISQTFWY